MSIGQDVVDQFSQLSMQITQEAIAYAAGGVEDATTTASIRQLRMLTASLNATLLSVPSFPPVMLPPTPIPTEAATPPAQ